jgi:hypothetical protein
VSPEASKPCQPGPAGDSHSTGWFKTTVNWRSNELGSRPADHSKDADLHFWSGWRDSNSRPPAPKAGALTKLRHIPFKPTVAYLSSRIPGRWTGPAAKIVSRAPG